VFEENEDVAGTSVAYCEACDRNLKRATAGLPLSKEKSMGISLGSRASSE